MITISKEQSDNLRSRFTTLYGLEKAPELLERFQMMLGRYGVGDNPVEAGDLWTEKDSVLITYADSIQRSGEAPLRTLRQFLCAHAKSAIRCVHILPFYPWTSDDGFSVVDYREVESDYGTWHDVAALGQEFDLMFDFVLNHCSRKSSWFRDFVMGVEPGRNYFVTADPEADLSEVVRPRASPLLTKTATRDGEEWVWTTFSSDQVDLNWQDSDLLFEFLDILFLYLSQGSRILRLDAVAFLWKKIGTNCLHLDKTHQVVKLFRDVLEIVSPETILLTETNVPHKENLSYFGQGDEAHMVYNFSLPPLLLHGLLRGEAGLVRQWAASLPDLPTNQTFLNFTASHDGIGVRPLQGLIDDDELQWLINEVKSHGGQVSTRALPDGSEAPYEMNIAYVDALSIEGDEPLSIRRFLCSQALMLALPGVPAVYIHSLLGTANDQEGFRELGYNRALNRKKWDVEELGQVITDTATKQTEIFNRMLGFLRRRSDSAAFHPNAETEFIMFQPQMYSISKTDVDYTFSEPLLGFIRRDIKTGEQVVCVFNFSPATIDLPVKHLHPELGGVKSLRDVLHGANQSLTKAGGLELSPYASHWFRV